MSPEGHGLTVGQVDTKEVKGFLKKKPFNRKENDLVALSTFPS